MSKFDSPRLVRVMPHRPCWLWRIFALALSVGLAGSSSADGSIAVVATTGQIGDALREITRGADVDIQQLCGPGVDPHSFQPAVSDLRSMRSADAIIYNGFHLEAKLDAILHGRYASKSWSMASAFPDSARLDWIEDGQPVVGAPYDPHIWNHLAGWRRCVLALASHLATVDPDSAETYRQNGERYAERIAAADAAAARRFARIPKERRVLVSAHDAFNYFAKVYDFETIAVLGIGNNAEADIKTMREVASEISRRQIPVIFLESITNPRVTRALSEACASRGWSVRIADEPLYSDDLGARPPVDTFLGAFDHNVNLIVTSLESSNRS